MASLKKRLKKAIRVTHKYVGRVISVAAPIAGAIVAGPLGAAAGTAIGTGARYYGEKQGALASGKKGKAVKKAGRRGIKAGLITGGIVTGGAAVLAIAGGTGVAASSVPALTNIFGATKKPKNSTPQQYGEYGQDEQGFVTQNGLNQALGGGSPGSSGSSILTWDSLTNSSRSIGATGAPTGDRDPSQLASLFRGSGEGLAAIPPIVYIGAGLALLLAA